MKPQLLAITLGLKGSYFNKINRCWYILDKKFNINYISSRSPKPHITLISGYSRDIKAVVNKLKKIKTKKFSIKSIGLSLLLMRDPLIYIRWEKNKKLTKLYQNIEKKFNSSLFLQTKFSKYPFWIPKTTIAYKDFKLKNIEKIYKSLKRLSITSNAFVEKIELMTLSLKYGEKIIFSKNL